jgi:hypothetical protein
MTNPTNHKYTKEELVNVDYCPTHGRELVHSEYGNPDSLKECPTCEAEIAELNRGVSKLQHEQYQTEKRLLDARFALVLGDF